MFLEAGLARDAARSATDEDVKRLQSALEANRRAIGSMPDFVETDIAFQAHQKIFQAIKRRDADAAEAAMRDHIEQLSRAFWDQYRDEPVLAEASQQPSAR